jgi:hypothetical protein
MSRSMITLGRSLDIICLKGSCATPSQHISLPTWVPNWHNLWSGGTTIQESHILENRSPFTFDPIISCSADSTILVAGVYVGRISGISWGLRADTEQQQYRQSPGSWLHSLERKENSTVNYDQQKSIWKTMMMSSSSHPVEVHVRNATYSCCSKLWTPEGRGSIYNTRIIDWIDESASFKIGALTLLEWSRLEPTAARRTQPSWNIALPGSSKNTRREIKPPEASKTWKIVNHALGKGLGGGMRLASLSCRTEHEAALVNPHTLVYDEIFFLRGCSIPVIVRKKDPDRNIYVVVGGGWLDMDREWFKLCHNVALGPRAMLMKHGFGDLAPTITTLSLE